jgi:hypothetical protein
LEEYLIMSSVVGNREARNRVIDTNRSLTRLIAVLCSLTLLAITGCSNFAPHRSSDDLLASGVIAISRPIPQVGGHIATKTQLAQGLPSVTGPALAESVIISRADDTITAFNSAGKPVIFRAEGAEQLDQGAFTITVKEEHPLWYAPRSYFEKRSLNIPKDGSRDRFRRAALGNRALFLNNNLPIHSGPLWLEEIGGIKVGSNDMSTLYSMLDVGTRVEVR